MNEKKYYRGYFELTKINEKKAYRIATKHLKGIFAKASRSYLNKPETPVELLVDEADTLKMLIEIYDAVGIPMAHYVYNSLPKQKHASLQLETKARKPKQYQQTIDQSDIVNYWKAEFLRYTQSKDCAKKVSQVTKTTKENIRKVIDQGVKEQLSHKQVAKLILEKADQIDTKKRALLIARTEHAVGSNQGAMYAAKSSGLVLYKKWIARSGDSRTRDAHKGMIDSTPIPIDELFTVGDQKMSMPGDSSNGATSKNICNCRCVISFVPASEVVQQGLNNPKPSKQPKVSKPKPVKQPDLFDKPIVIDDPTVFKPASSVAEATEYALDQKFTLNVDYEWIKDVEVANEINNTLFVLKQRFDFNTLVQIGADTNSSQALMSANYKNLNIKHSHWKTKKIIENNYRKEDDGDFKQRALRNLQACQSNYDSTRSPKWLKAINQYKEQARFNRWTVKYGSDKYLQSTIHHEFGHILHDQLVGGINGIKALNMKRLEKNGYTTMARQLNEEQFDLYHLAKKNGDIYKVSAYGATNHKEFFSETFVMYMAKDKDLPVYIAEFFDKLFTLTRI